MKQFKGFKPEAMQRIAGTLGYQGDMQGFNQYLNQNPDKMQQMGMYQQKALQMVNGGMVQNFANGGDVDYSQYFDQEGRLRKSDGSLVPTFSQTRPDATTSASTVSASGSGQLSDMNKFNQANQNAMKMGTGNPQSATYQASLGPAATDQQVTDTQLTEQAATGLVDPRLQATQVTPEQMAAQQKEQRRVDTLAGAKAKETKDTTGQEVFEKPDLDPINMGYKPTPEQIAEQKRINDAMQKQFGEKGNPDNFIPDFQSKIDALVAAKDFKGAEALGQQLQNNPAYKAFQKETDDYYKQLVQPVEDEEPDYSTYFDDQGIQRNIDGSVVKKEVEKISRSPIVLNTPDGSFTFSSKVSGTDSGNIYTIKDSTGRPVATLEGEEAFRKWAIDNNASAYDPTKGAPEKVNTDEMLEGLSWANHSQKGIDMLLESGKLPSDEMFIKTTNPDGTESLTPDPSKYTVSGGEENWIFTFEDGTSTVVNRYDLKKAKKTLADEITPVISKLKESGFEEKTKTFKSNQDSYRKYITDESEKGVTTDIENIEKEYNKTVKNIESKKLEVSRLTALAKKDPDTTLLDDEGKPKLDEDGNEIRVNSYYQELLDKKVEELADDMERQADLAPVYQSTQRTVKDLTKERFQDPASAITEEAGTKVIADKIDVQPDQFIEKGTGQLDSVAQGDTTAAKAFDADAPDTVSEQTYDGREITDTAEEKLKKLEAQTQDTLTREVVGQKGDLRYDSKADESLKVAEDRILKAINPTDLEVTANQLAEVKGKDLKAIEASISVSDRLKKIVAQTRTVDPKELPPPATISDNIMRSVQAIKETDAGLSQETTEYIAAKAEAFTVSSGTLAVAMQGDVTAQATVQGQLSELMKSFDNGTPAWAAGAMRTANAVMLSRGMGNSSMAAAAIVQAAMESAIPIAKQDAQVYAEMGMANLDNQQKVSLANAAAQQGLSLQNLSNEQQMNLQNSAQAFDLQKVNLSNRQSVELANSQIRATLQGKVLDNTQQSNIVTAARYAEQANINLSNKQQAVLQDNVGALQTNLADAGAKQQSYITSANLASALQGQVLTNDQQVAISKAARYSDAANLNFTSDQQEILHNSSLMQSIGLAELNTTEAATLQNAANFASLDIAELSNAQQAQVLNAQNFLQLDLANLSNEQQVAIFKAQAIQQTLLSDQASANASEQFNATSEMQVDQFNANLKTQVEQFNKAQQTAISQFNAGQDNAMEQFNVAQANAADQFNAQNELVIAQSNVTWRREVATADTAAQNRANEINAKNTLDIQNQAYDNMWQHYGDQMSNAYNSAESEAGRASSYAIAQLSASAEANKAAATRNAGNAKSLGNLAATILTGDLSGGILKGLF